jgi:hypothetical protein
MGTLISKPPALDNAIWPELSLTEWEGTYTILHLWSQIIGKIKLQFVPYTNHWWNITFTLSSSGLTTGIIPFNSGCFEVEFDLLTHELIIKLSDGRKTSIPLKSGTVAGFYSELKDRLQNLGIEMKIWPVPVEMEDRTPFNEDNRFREYVPEHATRFWLCLIQVNRVMQIFRSGFSGKSSPIHFFWGSLDLALTFFSGKPAPDHSGIPTVGKEVMVKAYNAELASFGFWGGKGLGEAAFYAYSYPEPENYSNWKIEPEGAYYDKNFREFIFPYSRLRAAKSPDKALLNFYTSAFLAAKDVCNWDETLFKDYIS